MTSLTVHQKTLCTGKKFAADEVVHTGRPRVNRFSTNHSPLSLERKNTSQNDTSTRHASKTFIIILNATYNIFKICLFILNIRLNLFCLHGPFVFIDVPWPAKQIVNARVEMMKDAIGIFSDRFRGNDQEEEEWYDAEEKWEDQDLKEEWNEEKEIRLVVELQNSFFKSTKRKVNFLDVHILI